MGIKGVELLAPAGSIESMKAAVAAGADAVYIGGSRFGARAYADNPDQDRMLGAIDYAHLHGVSLYMTVNTLVKEKEMDGIFDYLNPYYMQGMDGVIVQDMGVLSYIRTHFPGLPIHASTQMTITGAFGAKMLEKMGVKRVVPARELSLKEIRQIHEQTNLEIECFVHGALCYCYSGQCLLSSMIGGRSGNRGRCAQPCRLPYDVKMDQPSCLGKDKRYVMSLKDLCVLDILPELLEAGVGSLKIEGRMKSPRYTAGVVNIYRKYLDLYKKCGRSGYQVDLEDKKLLLDLFDRGGFTEGYYRQHNNRDMVALKEKPAFRQGNQQLFDYLDETYVNTEVKEKVTGKLVVKEGETICLTLQMVQGETTYRAKAEGPVVQTAKNQPIGEEHLRKQMQKTGNTPFQFMNLEVEIKGNGFLPVQALNELRRDGLNKLKEAVLCKYKRDSGHEDGVKVRQMERQDEYSEGAGEKQKTGTGQAQGRKSSVRECSEESGQAFHVLLSNPDTLSVTLNQAEICEIQIESDSFHPETWKPTVEHCHKVGKRCVLAMPVIFRTEAVQYFKRWSDLWKNAGFDGILVRSWEEIEYLKECGILIPQYGDHNLYCYNKKAVEELKGMGVERLTLPLELNSLELEQLGCDGFELISYGYLPVMTSAQCVQKTAGNCSHKPGMLYMKDRTGKELMVKNHCTFCYNTIYNPDPLSLLGLKNRIKRLNPASLRLQFVKENKAEMEAVIRAFANEYAVSAKGEERPLQLQGDFTRGHFKRGVE